MASTYGAGLRARQRNQAERNFGQKVVVLPDEVIEKQFMDKLTGRYNIKKSNLCERCFEYKSANGTCSCA